MRNQKWFQLVASKRDDIYRIILSIVCDPDVADDLTQNTVEYLLINPPPRKIQSWINGAIKLIMQSHYTKRGKYVPELFSEPDDIFEYPESSDYVSDVETKIDLKEALQQFTPPQRKVILMRLDGYTWEEIAKEVPLMTNMGWFNWYNNQALRLLRRFFKKKFIKRAA